MALLYFLRQRGARLSRSVPFFGAGIGLAVVVTLSAACEPGVPPELQPDETLRLELGLGDGDEVHTISIRGGRVEEVDPGEVIVPPGAWVQFVTSDFYVHELHFEVDSLSAAARTFLVDTDQVASPPMVDAGARFVLSFAEAPEGRYPFLVEGNGAPGRGVVVVRAIP